jgi:hypothetical protein
MLMKTKKQEHNSREWAELEFKGANFGDKRLDKRLITLASSLSKAPEVPINQASVDDAAMKAAYRFLANSKVTPSKILGPHIELTKLRARGSNRVLVAHDTSYLNFSTHLTTSGLTELGHDKTKGLGLHTGFAFNTDGLPLGILYQRSWGKEGISKEGASRQSTIESKNSYRWLDGIDGVRGACLDAEVVHVADRECDIFEVLRCFEGKADFFVIRSNTDRKVANPAGDTLTESLKEKEITGKFSVHVDSYGEDVVLLGKFAEVEIKVPANKTKLYRNCGCTVIEVSEENPPDGREKIEWRLLTNLPITSIEDIAEVIGYYKLRWRIEEFHRILKSGCTVEKILLNTAARLGNAIALYSTIAWRIFWMTHLARVDPNADASTVLTNSEIQSLKNLKRFKGKVNKNLTVRQAILWVGRLGGFIKTKRYPSPGNTTVWRGFTQLTAMSEMYESLTGGGSYG